MKGKATLILTDKNTGEPVKRLEEHNMVTAALEKLIQIPDIALLTMPTTNFYSKLLPIWNNLLTGVVLFDNTLEENAGNFMIPPTVKPVGSAGREYTSTNPMRGTLNLSQSGPIDSGYRFVWDFAPEKAVGTIRSIGLTNFLFANIGFSEEHTSNMGLTTLPHTMDGASNVGSTAFMSVPGTFFGKANGCDYYSFNLSSVDVTLYKHRVPDFTALKILDSADDYYTPVTVSEIPLSLPFTVTNVAHHFYNPQEDILYFFAFSTDNQRTVNIFEYAGVNPETGEVVKRQTVQMPYIRTYTALAFAVADGKFYVCVTGSADNVIFVFNRAGALIESKPINPTHSYDFFMANGYLMCTETYSGYTMKFFVEYPDYPQFYSDAHRHTNSDKIPLPYSIRYNPEINRTNLLLSMRTDYMATINNLSEPLEKTDRHALQIRYEITN